MRKRQDQHFNVLFTSDESLKATFECSHDRVVCAKCIGLGHCVHDCDECKDARDGQLNLFQGGI